MFHVNSAKSPSETVGHESANERYDNSGKRDRLYQQLKWILWLQLIAPVVGFSIGYLQERFRR